MVGVLHDDKRLNPPGEKSNFKYICMKQQSFKICERKTDRAERRNRQTHIIVEDSKTLHIANNRITRYKISRDVDLATQLNRRF